MAAPVVNSNLVIADVPFYIRKMNVTSGTTATAFTHGGPALVPDMVLIRQASTGPTASDAAAYTFTTTQITLDFEDEGSDTFEVYIIWFSAGGGGIS